MALQVGGVRRQKILWPHVAKTYSLECFTLVHQQVKVKAEAQQEE